MHADFDPGRITQLPEDRPGPFWPVLHYVYDGEEIVATLFWDHETLSGFDFNADGTLGDEVEATDEPAGWSVCILADTSPSPVDPRDQVPNVIVLGDLPVAEALEQAAEMVVEGARPTGCSYEESRTRLPWRPVKII